MKKLIIIFSLFILLFGCSDESGLLTLYEQFEYKYIAFNSLSDEQKETLIHNWSSAVVYQGKYQQLRCPHTFVTDSEERMCFGFINPGRELFINQKLIGVRFNTDDDPLLGPIIVIIDYESEVVIGYVPRF